MNNDTNTVMWTDVSVLALVDEYKKHPCLWDPSDYYFKVLQKKSAAWIEVAFAMQCSVPEVKRKMASVLASFRRERKREGRSNWFAYKHLAFLLDKFNCSIKKTREGDDVDDLNDTEDWWKENESINNDQNDIFLTGDMDDKTEIKIFDEFRNGLGNSSAVDGKNCDDTEEPDKPKRQHHPRKRIRLSKHIEDSHDEPDYVEISRSRKRREESTSMKKSISELFTAYVAAKLDTYNEYRKNVVQHKITEILFQADMGSFDKPVVQRKSPNMVTPEPNEDSRE